MTWTYKSRHIFAKPVVYEQGYPFIFGMLGFEFILLCILSVSYCHYVGKSPTSTVVFESHAYNEK